MPKYLLCLYQPDGETPSPEALTPVMDQIRLWREDLKASGSWVSAAGLAPAPQATVIRMKAGRPHITDGPFTETKEHIGGFTIIQVADLNAALGWARRIAEITTLPIEVREVNEKDACHLE
jgi:hypothetical protein